jgi:hypothetical protein
MTTFKELTNKILTRSEYHLILTFNAEKYIIHHQQDPHKIVNMDDLISTLNTGEPILTAHKFHEEN